MRVQIDIQLPEGVLFVRTPRELVRRVRAIRARMKEHGFGPLAVHAAYLANLAGPNPVFRDKTIELLRHELRVAPEYGASFVNVHIGSHMGSGLDVGVKRVAEAVEKILDINLTGPMLLTKAVAPVMKRQGRGRIVNISSVAGKIGTLNMAAYSACTVDTYPHQDYRWVTRRLLRAMRFTGESGGQHPLGALHRQSGEQKFQTIFMHKPNVHRPHRKANC